MGAQKRDYRLVQRLRHYLAAAGRLSVARVVLVAVLQDGGPSGDGPNDGSRSLDAQPDRGECRSSFGGTKLMVVVPGHERHGHPLRQSRERIDRMRIRTRSGSDERSDRPAWRRLGLDRQAREEMAQALFGRGHRGQVEDVSEQDQLRTVACDLFAQRRQCAPLPIIAEESRVLVLVEVQVADNVNRHERQCRPMTPARLQCFLTSAQPVSRGPSERRSVLLLRCCGSSMRCPALRAAVNSGRIRLMAPLTWCSLTAYGTRSS